ncbi:MAG: hypothetical protein VKK04_01550 [Synechococcales bacterium]|nr:hypothetical protein [Synechococcales bacterium]
MMRLNWLFQMTLVGSMLMAGSFAAEAQTFIREGKQQFVLMQEMAEASDVISRGVFADLQSDPNFEGDYNLIFSEAFSILDGYTVVTRGGFFPENAGIPREQQITVDESIYQLYRLDNGYELMVYRSPQENTSRYFIRDTQQ